MIKVATIPAVKVGKVIVCDEIEVERHRVDGSYNLSNELENINLTFDQLEKAYLAVKEHEK